MLFFPTSYAKSVLETGRKYFKKYYEHISESKQCVRDKNISGKVIFNFQDYESSSFLLMMYRFGELVHFLSGGLSDHIFIVIFQRRSNFNRGKVDHFFSLALEILWMSMYSIHIASLCIVSLVNHTSATNLIFMIY